ncbi:MoaD/ThiS family protein [Maledivibacter halophilus]|uniref:Molybdopterin converting factor, small subunit n=1 Tax=Maledivibacter halophilus TaxID=36842 RepID=A0A1T5MEJ2_9FIRM|nr:MoaD/ThiS family protein [Maledivibacter halophilus]SKC86503.1 Molybdopterin converting factor, small subunit [Maledivibacter halophilus]
MITIKFYSVTKRYNNNQSVAELELDDEKNIGCILKKFKIIPGEVEVILLNSKLAREDTKVKDGDVIELFPVFGGG